MTDDQQHERRELSLRPDTIERLQALRVEMTDGDLPSPTPDLFLHYLMDTAEAVRDGYYSEDDNE